MKLLVISHTPHYQRDGKLVAWGSTVRELDHLARLFDGVVHLAPLYQDPAPNSSLPYTSERIQVHPIKPAGGAGVKAKLGILAQYPSYGNAILQELQNSDVVHLRCPANISLQAVILLTIRRSPSIRWVKYAGNWRPAQKEPWSYTWQRRMLEKNCHRGTVSVNGCWPDQPAHVFTFPNPCLTEQELLSGRSAAQDKKLTCPLQLLFVGRVDMAKGAERVLQIASQLVSTGIDFHVNIIGDSPDRLAIEALSRKSNLEHRVSFRGWLPKPALEQYYAQAHFIILPSASEGWPKVLSEGMAFGAVPLAGAVSSIPQILKQTRAGLSFPPMQTQAFSQAVLSFLEKPETWQQTVQAGLEAAPEFSYSNYLEVVKHMFKEAWGISLKDSAQIS